MERLTEKIEDKYIERQERLSNGKIVGTKMCLNKLGEIEDLEERLQKYTTIDAISALKGLLCQYEPFEEKYMNHTENFMMRDYIEYNEKSYQLITVHKEKQKLYETTIFPVEKDVISGHEIYCCRMSFKESAYIKHKDILKNPEKYLSDKAIEAYFACKKCNEWCCTLCPYLPYKAW